MFSCEVLYFLWRNFLAWILYVWRGGEGIKAVDLQGNQKIQPFSFISSLVFSSFKKQV